MVAYLQSTGAVVAIPLDRVARREDLAWKPIDVALRDAHGSFLLTPEQLAPQMQVHHDERGYGPDVTTTPALLYTRGQLIAPQRLSSTALSADWEDKPPELVRWGKQVMQWVRRTTPDWHRYKHHRITAKAAAARDAGMEMSF